MEQTVIDYIYDYIEIDSSDISLLETEFVRSQMSRLKKLQHLGLISKIYPLARHDKLEHAYGTYWLCRLSEDWAKGLALNKKALRFAAILHCIGHLPFSYATEHAVLQLYHIHTNTKSWCEKLFKECVDFVGDGKLEKAAQAVISNNNSFALHRWFTAAKIARSKDFANDLGKQVVRLLLDDDLFAHQFFREIDRVDYVLRDIFYLGTGRIELNMAPFMAGFSKQPDGTLQEPMLFGVIDAAHEYLNSQFYSDGRVRCLEQVVRKSILREVIEGDLTIDSLLELDDDQFEKQIGDFEIEPLAIDDLINRIQSGELVEVGRVQCYNGAEPLVETEARIAGTYKARLHDYHYRKGIYVECISSGDELIAGELSVGIAYDCQKGLLQHCVGAFIRVEDMPPESPDTAELSYREKILSFILGFRIRPQFERFHDDAKPTVLAIVARERRRDQTLWDKKRWPAFEWGDFQIDISEKENDWVAEHFIRFPEHFDSNVIEMVKRSVERSRRRKGEDMLQYRQRRERFLEYSTYLGKILDIRRGSQQGWVLPCVKMLNEVGVEDAEIDVVSLTVPRTHEGPVKLELWEVSKDDSLSNRRDVEGKLEKISGLVGRRFSNKIKIVGKFNSDVLLSKAGFHSS